MDEIKTHSLKIKNSHGDNLTTDVRFISGKKNLPLVIFCHGFKGFKDWGGFPYMMDKFALAGNFTVSFNFSYNGVGEEGEDLMNFTRLDRFAKNTFSRELDDVGSVLDYFCNPSNEYLQGQVDLKNIVLIGHSRGGGIAILKTAEDSRISKLITVASVAKFDRHSEEFKKRWKEKGYYEVQNMRTKQMMRMDYDLIEDLEKNPQRLNIQNAISKISVPVLIIHGKQDLSVDYSDAETLYNLNHSGKTKMVLLENTGHTFGIIHPFQGTSDAFERVLEIITRFIAGKDIA